MQPRAPQGQLACNGCRVTLAYPLGAPSVRCPMCNTITQVRQIHVSCVCCRTVLMLPENTTLAMCPRCRTVMNIPQGGRGGFGGAPPGQAGGGAATRRPPPKQCVYIEGPPLRGENGKMNSNVSIGTKVDDDRI